MQAWPLQLQCLWARFLGTWLGRSQAVEVWPCGEPLSCWWRITALGRLVFPKSQPIMVAWGALSKYKFLGPILALKQSESWGGAVGQDLDICILKTLPMWFSCPSGVWATTLEEEEIDGMRIAFWVMKRPAGIAPMERFMGESKLWCDVVFMWSVFYPQNQFT